MRLHRINCTPFRIPFRRPLRIGDAVVTARAGLLLEAHGEDGLVGLGEVAPHPTAGEQTLHQVESGIAQLAEALDKRGFVEVDPWLPEALLRPLPPESRAGLETACCDLAAQAGDVGLGTLLGTPIRDAIPVNAIIDELEPAAAAAAASERVTEGFTCLKLKVGRDLARETARLTAVRDAAGAAVRIRIDANGIWSAGEAIVALRQLAAYGIEYVEQPVREMADLARVAEAVEMPVAADECVTDAESVLKLAAMKAADIIVVKPALLGLRAATEIIRTAGSCGLKAVVTSALDTSIGIAAAAHLAATLPEPILPCGLATAWLLQGDVVRQPLVPRRGWLRIPGGAGLGLSLDPEAVRRWRCG